MISASELPDRLLSEGRFWFTTSEASELLRREPKVIYPRLADLAKAKKIFSPAEGLYVVVPAEYRDWGVTPAEWFIDPLMQHLKRRYYVAFLSAAARHGAAHQAPQTFQVMVDRDVRDRDLSRIRLRFVSSQSMKKMETQAATSHTGSFEISTRETTAADLAWRPRYGGGISNVANVLEALGPLDPEKLAKNAAVRGRATARRLGWMVQQFRADLDPYWLRQAARPEEGSAAVLVPGNPVRGPVDRAWGLRVNASVEPD